MSYTPLTGALCGCKRGIQRDNCPNCEGTGKAINFRAIHAARAIQERQAAHARGECGKCANEGKQVTATVQHFVSRYCDAHAPQIIEAVR